MTHYRAKELVLNDSVCSLPFEGKSHIELMIEADLYSEVM